MRKSNRLPARFPEGTKYVLESDRGEVRRYVEFPDGRRLTLSRRKAATCCAEEVTLVPPAHMHHKRAKRTTRALEVA
jgi:hypothetical protein